MVLENQIDPRGHYYLSTISFGSLISYQTPMKPTVSEYKDVFERWLELFLSQLIENLNLIVEESVGSKALVNFLKHE